MEERSGRGMKQVYLCDEGKEVRCRWGCEDI